MRDIRANRGQLIARLAPRQHGVVSSTQLRDVGIDKHGISRRVNSGRLHRLHRGVLAVGHTKLTFEGRCMAAVLALGDPAVVSHLSAAALWGMLKPTEGPIHVTLPGDGGRLRRPGICIHRSHSLVAGVTTRRHGIAQGFRVLRFTHRQLTRERSSVVAALRTLLGQGSLAPNL